MVSVTRKAILGMILLFRHKAKPEKVFNSKLFKIVPIKKRNIALVIGKGLRWLQRSLAKKVFLIK